MICKNCGNKVGEDDTFCSVCGNKIEHIQCPYCGAAVEEDTVFCTNCGKKIGQPQPAEIDKKIEPKRCPACGNEADEDNKFCIFCGTKLDGTESEKPQTNTVNLKKTEVNPQSERVEVNPTPKQNYSNKPKNKTHTDISKKKVFLILAAVVIAVILAGVYFGNKAATKPAEKSTVSEEKNTADQSNNDSGATAESKTTNDSKSYSNNNNTYTAPVRRENFADYEGNWGAYLDNGKLIRFSISTDRVRSSYYLYIWDGISSAKLGDTIFIDDIDEYNGIAVGTDGSDDSYAVITFNNGTITVSTNALYESLGYTISELKCHVWTEDDERASYDGTDEYILPFSDVEYLSEYDLMGLSKDELKIARNEIYARHGRMFNDANLQAYFNSCSWYTPSISPENFSDSMLNEVEIANRDLIVSYETEMGYR